jgi:DNA-directed RNA polymerase specialized sigma24 family protein
MYLIARERIGRQENLNVYYIFQIAIQQRGNEWQMMDRVARPVYTIRKMGNELHIYGSLFRKRGRCWTRQDIDDVFNWLDYEGGLNQFVRFTYGLIESRFVPPLGKSQVLDIAEKAVDDGLTEAFRYIRYYDPTRYRGKKCPFLNWLYHIIARKAMKIARKIIDKPPPGPPEPDNSTEPDETSETDIWNEVEPYIDKLGRRYPKYKEAIELRRQGMLHAEAAENSKWPCSEGAMKVRYHRACQELRCLIKKDSLREKGGILS